MPHCCVVEGAVDEAIACAPLNVVESSFEALVGMDIVDALESNVRGNKSQKRVRQVVPSNPRGDAKVRQRWNNHRDFMIATIGYAVGLDSRSGNRPSIGNVWRFPYLCYQYGGGTFLIPYFLSVIFLGGPLVVLELSIGQYFQKSATQLFEHIHPRLKGVGIGGLVTSVLVCSYYSIIMAWSLVFLTHSFHNPVPWTNDNQYFYKQIIHRSNDIGSFEGVQLDVVLALLAMWVVIYLVTMRGVTLSGNFAAVTAVVPFIVLFVLFIKSLTLEGADEGIRYFLTYAFFPAQMGKIASRRYLGICRHTVFFLYMAKKEGRMIEDVVDAGPALAFIVYPEAISLLDGAPFWAVVFFLMLITLTIDSVFGYVEIINEWLLEFPKFNNWPRAQLSLLTCTAMFILGIFFSTHAGIYWVELLDHFVPTFALLAVALGELGAVTCIFKFDKLQSELYRTTGQSLGKFFKICWVYIDPFILVVLIIVIFVWETQQPYLGLPSWSLAIGWALSFAPVVFIVYYSLFPNSPENVKNLSGIQVPISPDVQDGDFGVGEHIVKRVNKFSSSHKFPPSAPMVNSFDDLGLLDAEEHPICWVTKDQINLE